MTNYASESKSQKLLQLGQITAYISYYYRKSLLEYCAVEGKTDCSNILMEFIRRIEINTTAIRTLVEASIKNESKSYFKLSIGLLIRSCLIDSILGLYLSALDEEAANKIVCVFNQDYVKSMPNRFEVYSDRCVSLGLDDDFLRHLYGLQIEDNFPNQIDWSSFNKDESSKKGFFKIQSTPKLTIAKIHTYLKSNPRYSILSKKLYAYYREYSQYEHFSVFARGSYSAFYEDDNPSMARPYEYIAKTVEYIVVNMKLSEQIVQYCNKANASVVKILAKE